MKLKKIIAVFMMLLMLIPYTGVSAVGEMLPDTSYWENISAYDATNLLDSSDGAKDRSFVFIFYSDTCWYSQNYVPQFAEYAKENGVKLSGLNAGNYPFWNYWGRYVSDSSITFPLVIAYNHETDLLHSQHSVHSVSEFEKVLQTVGFNKKPSEEISAERNTQNKSSGHFNDVGESDEYYDAVEYLSQKGIINGYDDNTFKPQNAITRAEAAAVIVRAANLSEENASYSTYYDVADNFWGRKYIMAATQAGIINGMGNNMFCPYDNVTYNQIIKMIVCMMSLEQDAMGKGGWPYGYLSTAVENGIIDYDTYRYLADGKGEKSAIRGDVAKFLYNALMAGDSRTVAIGAKKYSLGMSMSELDKPDEIFPSTSGYAWYVYGTKTYKDFVALGVEGNEVVAVASAGAGFVYNGYKSGDIITTQVQALVTDKNDNNKVHGVFIEKEDYSRGVNLSDDAFYGESKLNFHCTNAFRVLHGKNILKWSEAAAKAAQLHSEDMADNNYFSHDSIDGRKFSERISAQGINWRSCAENIYAGRISGFISYCGWVDSSGHRNNMLQDKHTHLGVGGGYSSDSLYGAYFTQDFYA